MASASEHLSWPSRPPAMGGDLDPTVGARAEAAYQFEFDKWQLLIEALFEHPGLSATERMAGLVALRLCQQMEALAARLRILDEEIRNDRAARQLARQLAGPAPG